MGKMIEFFKELLAPTVAAQAELAVLGVAPAEDMAITDLQKVVAFFEMAVIQGDDGGLESMYDRLDAVLGESDDDAR